MSNTKNTANQSPNFLGYIPGPYGRDIGVHRAGSGEDGYVFDLDASMDFAGIYRQRDRDACRADYDRLKGRGTIPFDIFYNNGGHKIPKEKIVRPKQPIYPTLPMKAAPGIPVENWVTLAMDATGWKTRADSFLEVIGSNLDHADGWRDVLSIGLQIILTAALEHLPDEEIDCLEAAAFYALTVHPEWSEAGLRWLEPFKATWFRDWAERHPIYCRFAGRCRFENPKLPAWLAGVR